MSSVNPLPRDDEDLIFADRFAPVSTDPAPAITHPLERLTYGARPDDFAAFNNLGNSDPARLAAWVDQQLDWQGLDDSETEQRIDAAGYQSLHKSIEQLWVDHHRNNPDDWAYRMRPAAETEGARIIRAVYSRRQLYEMLVEFWHDHFNVFGWEHVTAPVFVQHDRNAIRPHALGNFRAMLEEVAKSTAMMVYLDNRRNMAGGYNENFARELMELHTLGVAAYYPGTDPDGAPMGPDGLAAGYTDHDVYEVARCFTGWTIRDRHWEYPDEDDGAFTYRDAWHEAGNKYVLRQFITTTGQQQARTALDRLAAHPATAHHICTKLCRRFIADTPPETLISSAAEVFRQHWQADDQIARVLRHILLAGPFGQKVRRPYELFIAALRKTEGQISPYLNWDPDLPWEPYLHMGSLLRQTGHAPFRWPAPDGYPDTARHWTSVSVLGQSWRLLSRLPQFQDNDQPLLSIQSLTEQALPSAGTRNAQNIVDWWTARLISRDLTPARRTRLVDFLRQDAAPDAPLDIEQNTWGGANNLAGHYTQDRLRATVSLIMICPEFQLR